MRTILFCAVKAPLPKSIPRRPDEVLVEATERLCIRLRAMTFVPAVLPA